MHDNNVDCIACEASGYETMAHPETGQKTYKIVRLYKRVNVISDMDSSEGRVGEAVDMSVALGAEARNVTSRSQLRELKKRTRERVFNQTDGPKTVMREFVDAGTGKRYRENVTNNVTGLDLGEIHRVESQGENEIQSAFEPGETIEKTVSDLDKRIKA
jgi:hypothetical protein